jgi:hypothetical protein
VFVGDRPQVGRLKRDLLGTDASKDEYRRCHVLGPEPLQYVEAGHPRKLHVEHDHVVDVTQGASQTIWTRQFHVHDEAVVPQSIAETVDDLKVVFDPEDAERLHRRD